MNNNELQETTLKSIRLENSLIEQIEKMAEKYERDFTKQIKFMLKQYIEILELTK